MALTQDDLTAKMNAPVAIGPRMFTLHEQGMIGMELRELRDENERLRAEIARLRSTWEPPEDSDE